MAETLCPSWPVSTVASASAQTITGGVHTLTVERGDTLRAIGSRFGVDPRTIADDNGRRLDAPLPIGTTLTIDNRHIVPSAPPDAVIVINLPQRMLFVRSSGVVASYPVAVGSPGWRTPRGAFSVIVKEVNPTWDVPESIREEARRAGRSLPLKVPPGPANPLGAFWIGLSAPGVGIHGTNAPTSVYQAVTHGCIRLHPDDIAALFPIIAVGMPGVFVYEPILMTVGDGDVWLEAHRDIYARGPRDPMTVVRGFARALGVEEQVDWNEAATVVARRAGVARVVSRR